MFLIFKKKVWQKPIQFHKAIIIQLKNKLKKKKNCVFFCVPSQSLQNFQFIYGFPELQ